jgi:hypothetical protein
VYDHLGVGRECIYHRRTDTVEPARDLVPALVAAELAAYIRNTYPMPDYGKSAWANLLSGHSEVVYRYRRECKPELVNQYNRDGVKLVPVAKFPPDGWTPPITREQFWERFPYIAPELGPEPDDGGLFERVMRRILGSSDAESCDLS